MKGENIFFKGIGSAAIKAGVIVITLVSYGSRRNWVLSVFRDNSYTFGFFEGAVVGILIFGIFSKYGQPFYEAFEGLRELGRNKLNKTEE